MNAPVVIIGLPGGGPSGGKPVRRDIVPGFPPFRARGQRVSAFSFLPLVQPRKQSSGCLFQCLHSSVSVSPAPHAQERSNGDCAWGAEKVCNRSAKL